MAVSQLYPLELCTSACAARSVAPPSSPEMNPCPVVARFRHSTSAAAPKPRPLQPVLKLRHSAGITHMNVVTSYPCTPIWVLYRTPILSFWHVGAHMRCSGPGGRPKTRIKFKLKFEFKFELKRCAAVVLVDGP